MAEKLRLQNITHSYARKGDEQVAVSDINLYLDDGEFVALVGPSGCGKSTLLSILTGLLEQTSGLVFLDEEPAADLMERIAYMPQQDLLLPWMSVADNAALSLKFRKVPKKVRRRRVEAETDFFGLNGFEDAWPSQLSGGMRQRAALLRTFLVNRDVMLLDEPFGAIDAITRHAMQHWLLDLWERTRKTVLFVTHDVDEAVFLADRVYVLSARPGRNAGVVTVDLPRPRTVDTVMSEQFLLRKREVAELLGQY